jgi:hypothetical protein
MRVSIQEQLVTNRLGEEVEESLGFKAEMVLDKFSDVTLMRLCKDFIDFLDELLHLRNELNQSLWH